MAELRTYQNCCIMSILSYDPFRRYICSYLWFSDIFSLSLTCKELYDYLMLSDSVFATEMFNQLLSKSHRNIQTVHQKLTPIWNNKIMFAYAARLTQWPNKMQLTRRINYDILELDTVEGSVGNCYCYQGKHKGKNRSFVGNDHFPVPLPTSNLPEWMEVFRPYGSLPFTKIVTNPSNSKSVPVLSFIAYFEIKIHSPQVPSNAIPPRNNHKPCICIGISRPGFDIYKKMPGWDSNSYGFHSDDGMFFCGDASRGYRSTLNSEQNTFGVGDTVGFGIVYPSSCHFEDGTVTFEGDDHGAFLFTKNGVLQASLCIQDENFFHYSWFPTIGTDAYNPIEMNFGNKGVPFVFDIVSFERGLDCKFSCESIRQTFLPEFSENECFIRTLGRIRNKWSIFSLEKPIDFRYPLFKNFWVPWRDTENNYMDGEQFHNQAFKLTTQNQVRNESWLVSSQFPLFS